MNDHIHTHVLEDGTVIEHSHSHDPEHGHSHSHEHTKAVVNRLARAIGHLESIKRMTDSATMPMSSRSWSAK